jgi:AcrR family transcriptional regulator
MLLGLRLIYTGADTLVPRAGLTREKIVQAAAKLADDEGFDSLTLAAIARLFNVRLPSIYGHMSSAHDLKKGVALLALQRLAEKMEEAVAGRAGKDALIALANTYRNFAQQHPGLFQASRYPLVGESAAVSGGARLARVHHAMLRGYGLEDEDRIHATRLIGSFVLGFSLLELAGSFNHSMPDTEDSWRRSVDGLDDLLQCWARQETRDESH